MEGGDFGNAGRQDSLWEYTGDGMAGYGSGEEHLSSGSESSQLYHSHLSNGLSMRNALMIPGDGLENGSEMLQSFDPSFSWDWALYDENNFTVTPDRYYFSFFSPFTFVVPTSATDEILTDALHFFSSYDQFSMIPELSAVPELIPSPAEAAGYV